MALGQIGGGKKSSDNVIHDGIMHLHEIHNASSHSTKKLKDALLNWNTGEVSVASVIV